MNGSAADGTWEPLPEPGQAQNATAGLAVRALLSSIPVWTSQYGDPSMESTGSPTSTLLQPWTNIHDGNSWVINIQEPSPEGQHILKGGGEEGKGRFH